MMNPREVKDAEQVSWSCVQALETEEGDTVPVVCTPSGGAQSVRIELPAGWFESVPDDELVAAISRCR
jgi:hypothetical protein